MSGGKQINMLQSIKDLATRHSKDPADPSEVHGDIWVFTESEMEAFVIDLLAPYIRSIDSAYWQIEVGDRISALKSLAPYAIPRSINGEKK